MNPPRAFFMNGDLMIPINGEAPDDVPAISLHAVAAEVGQAIPSAPGGESVTFINLSAWLRERWS